jgi:hypothetical protein
MNQANIVILGGGMVAGYAAKQLVELGLPKTAYFECRSFQLSDRRCWYQRTFWTDTTTGTSIRARTAQV